MVSGTELQHFDNIQKCFTASYMNNKLFCHQKIGGEKRKLTKAVPVLALSFAPLGKLESSGVACDTFDKGIT